MTGQNNFTPYFELGHHVATAVADAASHGPRDGGGQPPTPRLSASGTAANAGGPGASEAIRYGTTERRRATTPGGNIITPGSNFDASEVDRSVFAY